MLVRRVVAPFLQANCYVVAPRREGVALVVDPGAGAAPGVARVLDELGLTVGAVLATHGHADHVWDAAAVAGDAPVYVAAPDLYRMADPLGVRAPGEPDFAAMLADSWRRPADVRELPPAVLEGGGAELLAGVAARAVPAPGHTEGSVVTLLGEVTFAATGMPDVADAREAAAAHGAVGDPRAGFTAPDDDTTDDERPALLALSGDVIFAGSVGRTDLSGGDPEVMTWSLRTLAASLDPATVLLPGHGPATWWGRELATNPWVREALDRA